MLRRYLGFIVAANLLWEFVQMPLYSIWQTGTPLQIVFAAVHCTGGDVLIALSAIASALLLTGDATWPSAGYVRVAAVAVLMGLAYTVFSEWWNVEVRKAWSYSDLMPIVPGLDIGLSPLLQWIIIPIAAFRWATSGERSK